MDFRAMSRDPAVILKAIQEVESGANALAVAKVPCMVYLPARYFECGLAQLGEAIRTVGVFPIVVDGTYAILSVITFLWLTPSSYRLMKVGEEDYYELSFDKGATMFPNLDAVKDDINAYYALDEFYFKGGIPDFLNEKDVAKLFTTSEEYSGFRLAPNNVPLELIVSAIARQAKDRTQYHRHSPDPAGKGDRLDNVAWIGLRNVVLGAQGTLAKIAGSRFDDGITSALRNPSSKAETLEVLLRL